MISSVDSSSVVKLKTPALLTTTSRRPASPPRSRTAVRALIASVTSPRRQWIWGCRARAASSASLRRASPKTVAPVYWNATAMASPMPEFAPVTRMTLPSYPVVILRSRVPISKRPRPLPSPAAPASLSAPPPACGAGVCDTSCASRRARPSQAGSGTLPNRSLSPSAIVGCVKMASRRVE
jgi:hypothetical protein